MNAAPLARGTGTARARARVRALHQTDGDRDAAAVDRLRPAAPFGSLPLAHLRLGEASGSPGSRPAAVAAYRAAIAAAPAGDPHGAAGAARPSICGHAPNAARAKPTALSLHGWRRLESGDSRRGRAALDRSLASRPRDPVAHYRLGRVLQGARRPIARWHNSSRRSARPRSCPAPILGARLPRSGARLERRRQDRDDAIDYYRTATSLFGAAADTRVAATRALTRLHAQYVARSARTLRSVRTITLPRSSTRAIDRRDRHRARSRSDRRARLDTRTLQIALLCAFFDKRQQFVLDT